MEAVAKGYAEYEANGFEIEDENQEFINYGIVDAVATEIAPDILTFPAFTKEFCEKLLEETLNSGVPWERNPDEDQYRSMPEIRLRELDEKLFEVYRTYVLEALSAVAYDRWKCRPHMLADAQIACYDPTNQKHGNWHHDESSDITFVVPLSDDFEGGGTEFYNQKIKVSPLPVGHCLMFPGRVTHIHRGMAVTKGKRYILTAWTKIIGAY